MYVCMGTSVLFANFRNNRQITCGGYRENHPEYVRMFVFSQSFLPFPAVGFNVETVTYKNISFVMWDLGGQTTIRYFVFAAIRFNVLYLTAGTQAVLAMLLW